MSHHRSQRTRVSLRYLEELESRELLSAHGLAHLSQLTGAAARFASESREAPSLVAQFAAHNQVFGALGRIASESGRNVLSAQLSNSDGTATGTATYKIYTEDGVTETEFKLTISGAPANAKLDVLVNGSTSGAVIETDADGHGTLVLSSNPDSDEEQLPEDFPTIDANTTIAVDALQGTYAAATNPEHHCGGHAAPLSAQLTDSASGATGTATFTAGKHSAGGSLTVTVTGTTASTDLDVAIDGSSVGTLTTDDTGAGTVTLNDLTIGNPAGLTITVGSLSGIFPAETSDTTSSVFRFSRRR
jgi:hypothetical protein